jgi:PAS domain S-box-containing protein
VAKRSEGWESLFWTAFKRSQNLMALLDEQRRIVEVNGACLSALGRSRNEMVGANAWAFVKDGPARTEPQWRALLADGSDFFGEAELVHADGTTLSVHYAAHPEVVTGRRLVLFVALDTARRGRFARRHTAAARGAQHGRLTRASARSCNWSRWAVRARRSPRSSTSPTTPCARTCAMRR